MGSIHLFFTFICNPSWETSCRRGIARKADVCRVTPTHQEDHAHLSGCVEMDFFLSEFGKQAWLFRFFLPWTLLGWEVQTLTSRVKGSIRSFLNLTLINHTLTWQRRKITVWVMRGRLLSCPCVCRLCLHPYSLVLSQTRWGCRPKMMIMLLWKFKGLFFPGIILVMHNCCPADWISFIYLSVF